MASFSDFIRSDKFFTFQRATITKLALTTEKLQSFQIQSKPDLSLKKTFRNLTLNQNESDLSYKLEKLKLQIIDGVQNEVNFKRLGSKARQSKRLTWIIILSILDKKQTNILKMLGEKDIDFDIPIFGLKHMPTLYYLACIVKCDNIVKHGDYRKHWMGIPAGLLYGNVNSGDVRSVMSVTQFKYFNDLIKVYQMIEKKDEDEFFEVYKKYEKRAQSMYEMPILYSDLFCTYNSLKKVAKFLPKYYNVVKPSKMIYLLQCDTSTVLLLQEYGISPYNFYCNLSPLHVSAYYGNIEVLAMYIELAFNPNKQDYNGNTPMHFAAIMGNKTCYDLMCYKKYVDTCQFSYKKGDEHKMNNRGQQPINLLKSSESSTNGFDLKKTLGCLKKARSMAESFKNEKFRLISFDAIFNNENCAVIKKHVEKLQTLLVDEYDSIPGAKHNYELFCKILIEDQ